MSSSYQSKPWYIQKKKTSLNLLNVQTHTNFALKFFFNFIDIIKLIYKLFFRGILSIIFIFFSGYFFSKLILPTIPGKEFLIFSTSAILFLMAGFYFLIAQIGTVCTFFMEKKYVLNNFVLGIYYLQSKIEKSVPKKGLMAPEMILRQFLQQVRIYSSEKNYYNQKRFDTTTPQDVPNQNNTLKRRWNDVQDTLDEFDIYLANNPQDVIAKLAVKSPHQIRDVSHLFSEIAETAESTWRAKGVHIEHAIVVPLKSDIDEKLLRRLLAGAWRSCAYLCARGNGVVFSAKSEKNKIVARWECDSVTFPNTFFEIVKNQNLSLNERIELGMEIIANDPKNSSALFGLISLIIWHELAVAAEIDFNITQGNEGMILKLKV